MLFISWNQSRQLKQLLNQQALLNAPQSHSSTATNPTKTTLLSDDSTQFRSSYADAVAMATPSVVKIFTARVVPVEQHPLMRDPLFSQLLGNRQRNQQRVERGLGSGVIVYSSGLILTNYHVIKDADQILVMLNDGRQQSARLIGSDEGTDLALLSIDLDDLPAAEFADMDDVAIGDVVLAIGNPYGIGQTVTQGIVSALGRNGINLNTYENYIQTDAAINEGNSGGALVTVEGKLVGINSGLYSRSGASTGIGFAIPIDIASFVLDNFMQHGKVIRGWLGISVEELSPLLSQQFGLEVDKGLILTGVAPDGPAQRAGLMPGDIITHIEGEAIGDGNTGMHIIAQSPPGQAIDIRLLRGNVAMSLAPVLDARPTPINQSRTR